MVLFVSLLLISWCTKVEKRAVNTNSFYTNAFFDGFKIILDFIRNYKCFIRYNRRTLFLTCCHIFALTSERNVAHIKTNIKLTNSTQQENQTRLKNGVLLWGQSSFCSFIEGKLPDKMQRKLRISLFLSLKKCSKMHPDSHMEVYKFFKDLVTMTENRRVFHL